MASPAKNPGKGAPEDQEDDVDTLGSHRHAQTYFDTALVGDVADEPVDADNGKKKREAGEGGQHIDNQAAPSERTGDQ